MKSLLIINPISGGKRGRKLRKILLDLVENQKDRYEIVYTEFKGHATALAKELAPKYGKIFISGGDGTISEFMNGIDKKLNKIIGIFPIGTGNDFFSSLNLTQDIKKLFEYYHGQHKSTKFDLFKLNYKDRKGEFSHIFSNALGIGFDAFVAHNMEKFRGLPGVSAYIASVLKSLKKLKFINIKVSLDNDSTVEGEKLLATFSNSNRSGGGFYLTPKALIYDGHLDIGIIEKIGKIKLLRSLPLALVNKIDKMKEISFFRTTSCKFSLSQGYYAHADGEIISDSIISGEIIPVEHSLEIISGLK